MMGDHQEARIWKPSVEYCNINQKVVNNNDDSLSASMRLAMNHQTKTSLAANDRLSDHYRNLNRVILSRTQSYNTTPRPFSPFTVSSSTSTSGPLTSNGQLITTRQNTSVPSSSSSSFIDQNNLNNLESGQDNTAQQVHHNQQPPVKSHLHQSTTIGDSRQSKQAELSTENKKMDPQEIIHKQYNSPINLYSMDNIRKTIEAHTEMIAPGLKGIEFRKPETPVNKESEVYKLIKEEEEQRQHRSMDPSTSRISPISGEPIKLSNSMVSSYTTSSNNSHDTYNSSTSLGCNKSAPSGSSMNANPDSNFNDLPSRPLTPHVTAKQLQEQIQHQKSASLPKCAECNMPIIGPFARVLNHDIHAHCFNCTTCGTSLKNRGFFTVNEKLYCELHAQQVAKVLGLNYNFNETHRAEQQQQQQPPQQAVSGNASQSIINQASISGSNSQVHQSQSSGSHEASSSHQIIKQEVQLKQPQSQPLISMQQQTSAYQCQPNANENRCINMNPSRVTNATIAMVDASSGSSYPNGRMGQHQQADEQASILMSTRTNLSHANGKNNNLSSIINTNTNTNTNTPTITSKVPICHSCHKTIVGPYIMAGRTTWCKLCSQRDFNCQGCHRSLLNVGFIEDSKSGKHYCEHCFEAYFAPICSKCNLRIRGDCVNALTKQWHPSCFICGHCKRPFGESSFYLEDNVPYCERDWNLLFTTKCCSCGSAIEAGDKWIEALDKNYHTGCFRCTSCQVSLEGSVFYCKGGKPFCRMHAR